MNVTYPFFGQGNAGTAHPEGDHTHSNNNEDSASALTAIRVTSIVGLFVMSAAVGLTVLRYGGKHRTYGGNDTKWYHIILRYINPFCGGLFLSLGLIHILPEANESMVAVFGEQQNNKYRYSSMVAAMAFCLLLFLQRVVSSPAADKPSSEDLDRDSEDDEDTQVSVVASTPHKSTATYTEHDKPLMNDTHATDCGCGSITVHVSASTTSPADVDEKSNLVPTGKRSTRGPIFEAESHHGSTRDADHIRHSARLEDCFVRSALLTDDEEASLKDEKHRTFTAVFLMAALSVHSVAAGLALGLSEDVHGALIFLIAIVLHKWAAAMALGNSFALCPLPSVKCSICITFFSASTPLGVGLGWAAAEFLPKSIDAFLTSFTAGTFLYLAGDVITEEFAAMAAASGDRLNQCKKFFAFICGLSLVYAVTAFSQ